MTKLPLTVHGRLYRRLKAVLHSNLREYPTRELVSIRSKARKEWVRVNNINGVHNNMAARQVAIANACTNILNARGVQ